MEKNFESISELIKDPIFVQHVEDGVEELINNHALRPKPGQGLRYQRDWYDRMTDAGGVTSDFFIARIEAIWNKRTSLSSELRSIIQYVCDSAVYKTHQHYAAIPEAKPKVKRPSRKKVAVVEGTKEEASEFDAMNRKPAE